MMRTSTTRSSPELGRSGTLLYTIRHNRFFFQESTSGQFTFVENPILPESSACGTYREGYASCVLCVCVYGVRTTTRVPHVSHFSLGPQRISPTAGSSNTASYKYEMEHHPPRGSPPRLLSSPILLKVSILSPNLARGPNRIPEITDQNNVGGQSEKRLSGRHDRTLTRRTASSLRSSCVLPSHDFVPHQIKKWWTWTKKMTKEAELLRNLYISSPLDPMNIAPLINRPRPTPRPSKSPSKAASQSILQPKRRVLLTRSYLPL